MNAQTPAQRGNLIDLNITASPQLEHAPSEGKTKRTRTRGTDTQATRTACAQTALEMWQQYTPAPIEHPAFEQHGVLVDDARVIPASANMPFLDDGIDWLALPLTNPKGEVVSLAYLHPEPNQKPRYFDGYAKGAYVPIKPQRGQVVHVVSNPQDGRMLWLAGVAAVVCFTPDDWSVPDLPNPFGDSEPYQPKGGNMAHVARAWVKAGYQVAVPVTPDRVSHYRELLSDTGAVILPIPEPLTWLEVHELGELPQQLADLIKAATPEIKPPKNNGFGLVHISDLLSDIRPTDWLIHGFFESDSMSLLFGDPAAGKSFVAIDLAACIATGKDWHGHKTKQGAVIYIAGEGMNGISKRFKAWSIHNNTELNTAPLFVSKRSAQLSDEALAKEAADVVSGICSEHSITPALIVIDTLARNFGAADENSTRDMNAFISNVDSLLRIPYNACVLIVHHAGHGDKNRGRGSSALKGALDAEYSVTKQNRTSPIEGEIQTISLHSTKMKDAAPPQPKAFDLVPVHIKTCEVTWEDIGSAALSISDYDPLKQQDITAGIKGASNTALDCLKALYTEHITKLINQGYPPADARVTLESWRDRFKCSAECFGKSDDAVRKAFNRSKKLLSEKLIVSLSGEYAELSQDLINQIIEEM